MRLATFADCHGWLPFLRGTDGLTGRERRLSARMHRATVGSMTFEKLRAESPRMGAVIAGRTLNREELAHLARSGPSNSAR